MKKLLLLSSGMCLCLATNANAATLQNNEITLHNPAIIQISADEATFKRAQNFVTNVADQGIGFLGNESLSQQQRKAAFKKLLKQNFDMRTLARFALGRYWKTASKTQQNEYMRLFEKNGR